MLTVLGIESSCDETAAAVVKSDGTIVSNVIASQISAHEAFGGVVPEIAARAHLQAIDPVVARALSDAETSISQIDAIAASSGPGLIGGLVVSCQFAKGLAFASGKQFLPINHLEGHALTVRLTDKVAFPYLLLLISGGHCQILRVNGVGDYQRWGTTLDDAAGEAFDKTAKLLGLGFPGGPALEACALSGDANAYAFPTPMKGRDHCDFSFSGLKTAVLRQLQREAEIKKIDDAITANIAASFQRSVAETIADRCRQGLLRFRKETGANGPLVIAGGVAANVAIKSRLAALSEAYDTDLVVAPPALCTDNAAMIAWAGIEHLRAGTSPIKGEPFAFRARPRWPLDDQAPKSSYAGLAKA